MLDLVDGVLQLLVEDAAVGDDDDAVVDLLIAGVVQAREPVREPGDAVRLAAAGGVLDEVVASRAVRLGGGDQLVDRVELVVAREDDGLALLGARALRVRDLLLAVLDEHVGAEDVEEALPFEHLLPEVAGAVAGGVGRVAGPAADGARVAAPVEGQEARGLAGEPRGHVDLFRVGREVDEGSLLEAEEGDVRVAVLLVLADCVAPRLPGHRVLQLAGGDGHAVEREEEVDLVAFPRVAARLARDGQFVPLEASERVRVEAVRRFEVGEAEGLAEEAEAVAEDVQRPLVAELLHERLDKRGLEVRAVERGHLRPELRLRVADEREGARGEQRAADIPLLTVARPPATSEQHRLDGGLERELVCVGTHRLCLAIPAVTWPLFRSSTAEKPA